MLVAREGKRLCLTDMVLFGFENLSQRAWTNITKLLLQVIILQGGHYSTQTGKVK